MKDTKDAISRLGLAINKVLPRLAVTAMDLPSEIKQDIVAEILYRVAPHFAVNDVSKYIKGLR